MSTSALIASTPSISSAPKLPALDGRSMLETLCESDPCILTNILSFLVPYEQVGLGRVSKKVKNACYKALGYDPFAGDQWMNLGNLDVSSGLSANKLGQLSSLAESAYEYLKGQITKFINGGGSTNQPVELLAELLKQSGRSNVDCIATLKMGEATLWSSNFTSEKTLEQMTPKEQWTRVPENTQVNVGARHAEMRLVIRWKLTHPEILDVELPVDKICCIFCASQMKALGLGKLIVVQGKAQFGKLNWYNFAPIVVFFKQARSSLWGADVEKQFAPLSPQEKQQFLFLLARQAAPSEKKRKEAPSNLAGPVCDKCGAPMVKRTRKDTNQQFWRCSNFQSKGCKGTKSL